MTTRRSPRRETNPKTKYIVRISTSNTKGYQVRVPLDYYRNPAAVSNEFVADSRHGGPVGAYQQALAIRDRLLEQTGQTELLHRARGNSTRFSRTTSGVIGVRRESRERHRPSGPHLLEIWRASGQLKDGKSWRRSFSCVKYGEAEAFVLACQERFKRNGALVVTGDVETLPAGIPVPYVVSEPKSD